jgi:hypothetical protein
MRLSKKVEGAAREEMLVSQDNKMFDTAREWFTDRHNVYLEKREEHLAQLAALDLKMEEKKAEVIKSAWKWKKTVGDPLPIRQVNAEIAAVNVAIETLDLANAGLIARMEGYWTWDKEEAEIDAWRNGGPPPAFIQQKRAAEMALFFEESVSLPIKKTF